MNNPLLLVLSKSQYTVTVFIYHSVFPCRFFDINNKESGDKHCIVSGLHNDLGGLVLLFNFKGEETKSL